MDGERHGAGSEPKGKGKGKEATATSSAPKQVDSSISTQAQHDSSADRSLVGRISSSAASLSRAALSSRPEDLSGGSSGKAQLGTSSAPKLAQPSETATYHGIPTESDSGQSSVVEEARFQSFLGAQGEPDELQPRQPSQPQTSSSPFNQWAGSLAVAQQEAQDGLEVTDLLNMPDLETYENINDSLQSGLSSQEEESLREALFGSNGDNGNSKWAALLDFEPDFLQGNNSIEARRHFGAVDLQHAKELWMGSWEDVLTSYTDEVWGDLGALAREAQKEVQEARKHGQQQGTGDMKALQRLKQILAHLRGTISLT